MTPRLKKLLLLQPSGGLLPRGFTELEYLESSGTQYLDTGLRGCDLSSLVECRAEIKNTIYASRRMFQGQGFAFTSNRAGSFDCYITLPIGDNSRKTGYTPSLGSQEVAYFVSITNGVIEINGRSFTADDILESAVTQNDAAGATLKVLAYPDGVSYQGSWWVGKLYSFSARLSNGAVRFIPALRNSDGMAGMWDTVSKSFFSNAGSGTFGYRITRTGEVVSPMSLRDPHRVAPSGVYARKVGENELEIVADTEEISGDGWEWFANTAEAYEHFGIVPQGEELLTE